MTACPRCDGPLHTYTAGPATGQRCSDCGYVGIPVDHQESPDPPEPWERALERFRSRE